MSEQVEIGGADFASLRERALVEVLETLEPSRLAPGSVDLNQLLAAIDPADLRQSDFRKLLTVLVKFAAQDSDSELGAVDARTLIRLIAGVPREQLDAALAVPDLRTLVLEEIFRRMEAHVRSERVKKTRAVVRWRLTGGTGTGGFDRYETVLADGTCRVAREMSSRPRVTITLSPADFIRLIIRQATPPVLFVTGKIQVKGDLGFAAGLIGYFDLPTA